MALINCPGCGKEVSENAAACPNCGEPVNAAPEKPQKVKSEGIFMGTLNVGCMIVLVIIGVIIFAMMFA